MNWVLTTLANLSISDWFGFISALALVVVALLSLYDLIYGRRDRKLKKIDEQLTTIYFPIRNEIETFQYLNTHDSGIINDTGDLKTALEKIERDVIEVDEMVMKMQRSFVGSKSNTNQNLIMFLGAVNIKIGKLKDEKRKYL